MTDLRVYQEFLSEAEAAAAAARVALVEQRRLVLEYGDTPERREGIADSERWVRRAEACLLDAQARLAKATTGEGLETKILAALAVAPSRSLKHLARVVGLHSSQVRALADAVAALVTSGRVLSTRGVGYRLAPGPCQRIPISSMGA